LLEQHETAIVDSGCTGHFLLVNAPCLNKVKFQTPLTVRLPNGAKMESSHTADLDIPKLNAAASKAHVFPGTAHHYLLSVGQLCDEGYIVTFRQDTVTICNSESSKFLSGPRDLNTGIWRINLKHTNNHTTNTIENMEYSALVKDPRLQPLWTRGFGNECGRLFQGIRDIPGTDTCSFVELKNIPNDRKITYGKIVCDYKPHKKEKEPVRLTVGGNILDYSGDVATSTADVTTFKILINSTLSTEDAAMKMMDIKHYYLGTPLPRFEYMKMLLSRFPEEIIQKYNLNALAVNGWVYIEIRKGIYGLKQAGLLSNQLLQMRLAPFGYYPARHTPGLWLHKTRQISFTLVVDDFAVKYVGKHHAEHLRNALLQTYELKIDWMATVYSGTTLKWYYDRRMCDISMHGYISNVLSKFQHDSPKHPQHTLSRYVSPVYGAKTQYATKDETPPLTAKQCLTIQKSHRIRSVLLSRS
jgi:hypothetical protein